MQVRLDQPWEESAVEEVRAIGYDVARSSIAVASAVGLDAATGRWVGVNADVV
ncbi:MAG: hypothetical protein R2748_08255 [Bryobacterales bacterium]